MLTPAPAVGGQLDLGVADLLGGSNPSVDAQAAQEGEGYAEQGLQVGSDGVAQLLIHNARRDQHAEDGRHQVGPDSGGSPPRLVAFHVCSDLPPVAGAKEWRGS